ncbi:MAG: ComEA family DNA-binding protein [Dehalococcoidales bacterium]|jgi:competence protein ComEA
MHGTSGTGKHVNAWILAALVLILVIVAGALVIWLKSSHNPDIEISLALPRAVTGSIYVGGEVNNPGWYPLFNSDNFTDIIRAAGGLKDGADLSEVELTVGGAGKQENVQKIDINRAAAWLLEALPDVGEAKAQAIIDYRQKNGPFRDIYELEKVPGFGPASLEKLKDLITVND